MKPGPSRIFSFMPAKTVNQMKILSIQYGNIENPYSHGGLANLLHETFKRMAPRHDITSFTGLFPGPTQTREIDGITYVRKGCGANKYINRLSFSLINSLFKPLDAFDLVLIPWDRYAPVRIDKAPQCPIVQELNLDFFSIPSKLTIAEPITRYLLKKNLERSQYIISACQGLKAIASQYAKNARLFEVFPGGVPGEYLSYPVDIEKEDYLLYIGRLDISHKGIDILLEAYKKAAVALPLVIAGDGIDKAKVEDLIKEPGLTGKVKLAGWVQGREKFDLIAKSLAVCAPSRVEGWGIVATEAAALGKPVIATRVTGLEEAVFDGQSGILVENENIEELSNAIKQLVQDKELRRSLGKQARQIAHQFTWETIAAQREDFFHRVIDDFIYASGGPHAGAPTKGVRSSF
jgi:glycosyltransferase involved in cell wall biosynthesis